MPVIESFADIGDYIDKPIRIYSSGMQARLAFAVATAKQPDILIVDEALSVGDIYFQSKCYARISEYKKNGMTLLLVSHAAVDIAKQCNRAIFLRDGVIYKDGPARDVVNTYMDHLFGSGEANGENSESAENSMPEGFSSEKSVEHFHERPGYRKEEYRWGRGGAKILDYVIKSNGQTYPASICTNDVIEIYFSVIFHEATEYVTPGLLIKTMEGIYVYGTNSHISSKGEISLASKKGDIAIYKFQFRVCLNEGVYLLSLGISSGDPAQTTEPIDRRYDSIIVNVVNPVHMWGLVDLQSKFEVCNDL